MSTPMTTKADRDHAPKAKRRRAASALPPVLMLWVGCLWACTSRPGPNPDSGKLTAFVTIQPQAFAVQRIGGDHVDVHVMVAPGQSYHTYEPTPLQIAALADARVYFGIGIPIDHALQQKLESSQTGVEFVDTGKGITRRPGDGCSHDHDHAGHDHLNEERGDPHIWMSPKLVKVQARIIADTLKRLDPAHADDYERNLASLLTDINAADERISRRLAPFSGRTFFVFHPSFGYFADAYGLKQVGVEEEGKEPSAKHLMDLVDQARKAGVKVIFVQPQFASGSAQAVAREIGGSIDTLDPLAADYLPNLERIAEKIAQSFEAVDQAGRAADVR